jgi:hypothetical protein
MTQKYFIGKCGGKDCSWRLHDGTNRTYYCSLDLYMHNCPKKVYENCPHGQTLGQMAEIGGKAMSDALVGVIFWNEYREEHRSYWRNAAKAVIKALLGGEEQK